MTIPLLTSAKPETAPLNSVTYNDKWESKASLDVRSENTFNLDPMIDDRFEIFSNPCDNFYEPLSVNNAI